MVVARLRAAGCVFAEEEATVLASTAASPAELDAMVARRAGGEPLEQVVGWAEFAGLRVFVDAGVFVPRRRSEFLVEVAVLMAGRKGGTAPRIVVDLCCGTGALGLAVAVKLDQTVEAKGGARMVRPGRSTRRSAIATGSRRLMSGSAVSNCTRPTWTRPPSPVPGGTSSRPAGTCTPATCSPRCRTRCGAGPAC